jgi:hypothetical protein
VTTSDCTNNTQDFFETDVDCGGSICGARCSPGKHCGGDGDCTTNICRWNGAANVCVNPTDCNNGRQDFFETDADCGGSICSQRCSPGQHCGGDGDCSTGICRWNGAANVCVTTSDCHNSAQDFFETDVDCGGSICGARCVPGKHCGGDGDCTTNICRWNGAANVCVDPNDCHNDTQDFFETDVDCGGSICSARCLPDQHCGGDGDCSTSICRWNGATNVCVDPNDCTNTVQDFFETDVDCGGSICSARCASGKHCGSGSDCQSGVCQWNGSANLCN